MRQPNTQATASLSRALAGPLDGLDERGNGGVKTAERALRGAAAAPIFTTHKKRNNIVIKDLRPTGCARLIFESAAQEARDRLLDLLRCARLIFESAAQAPEVLATARPSCARLIFESAAQGTQITGKQGPVHGGGETRDLRRGPVVHSNTTGWQPLCECGVESVSACAVLDPFSGAGTWGSN